MPVRSSEIARRRTPPTVPAFISDDAPAPIPGAMNAFVCAAGLRRARQVL